VCVALANILSKDEKRWRQVLKATYEKQFTSGQCYTYLSAHLGSKNRFAAPVMCIGQHRQIKNNSYWLRLDLVDFSSEGIVDKAIIRKKVPDTNLILSKSAAHLGKAIVSKNLDWLNDHNDLWSGLVENTLNQSYEGIENIDVDAALYQSDFFSENEIDYMSKLHDTNPSEWLAVPGVSKRLLPMVQKWLWRHHWQGLDDKSLSKAIALALNPGCDFLGKPKVGYSERLHRIDELIKVNNENKENLELLRNLKMYYHHNLSVF
jgi:exodeoxyribonuclease-1